MMHELLKNVLSFGAAFGLSAILIRCIIKMCIKFTIFDRSGGRKIHTGEVGRLGGAGIIISFIVVSAVCVIPGNNFSASLLILFAAMMTVFFMGLYDDIKGISARIKFPLQIAAAAAAVYSGVLLHITESVSGGAFNSEIIDSVFTIVWILAFMNAVNLIDGMDGLSSGLVMIALYFFAALGLQSGNANLLTISLILIGSTAGFYIFNFPPAKIFMGDAGAYSIGFILAIIIPVSFNSVSDIRMITFPAVIFLVPFLDVGQVIIRRLLLKKAVFMADNNHIHHKLLASGYSAREVLLMVYPVSAIFGCLGIIYWSNGNNFSIYLFVVIVILAAFTLLWISDIEKKTEKLSGIIEPGFKWCEHYTKYYPQGVQTNIRKHNGRRVKMQGDVHEISTGGFFYSTAGSYTVGDDIFVTLILGERRPLNLEAVIVNVSRGNSGYPAGFECRYTNAGFIAKKRIMYHLLSVKAEVKRRDGDVKIPKNFRVINGGSDMVVGK